MAGTVRFDFQGYYMMAAMHVGICLLLGGAGVALPQGNEKTAGKDRS